VLVAVFGETGALAVAVGGPLACAVVVGVVEPAVAVFGAGFCADPHAARPAHPAAKMAANAVAFGMQSFWATSVNRL
jgi:hypothetical protein